ncbi:MAG: REP-associated tyrosine transposase, partial [Planctomycetota bacterium]
YVAYLCTITILEWLPILTESRYCNPIIDSLKYCRNKKNLCVMAYVIMPNHIHLIAASDHDIHTIMRDFKRFTSRSIHDLLKEDNRNTLLRWLSEATEPARRAKGELSLWQSGFHPKAILSEKVFQQKLRYIHENPVRKGLVTHPADWWYSSARIEAGLPDAPMDVDSWYK